MGPDPDFDTFSDGRHDAWIDAMEAAAAGQSLPHELSWVPPANDSLDAGEAA